MSWSFLDFTGLSHFFGKLPEKLVTTDTTQTISGTKSFSSTILGSVSGSAASAAKDGAGNVIADTYETKADAATHLSKSDAAGTYLSKTDAASAYVQTGAVDQTVAGTKTFSKPIAGSVTGSSGSCTGNAATATKAVSADSATNASHATSADKATKAEQDGNGNNIVASYVAAGSEGSTTDIGAFMAARPSFIKSFTYNNVWTDAISMRHCNGGEDGSNYGTYIRSSKMTGVSNLLWNHQYSGKWQGERTLVDSANLADFIKSAVTSLDASKLTGTASVSTTGNAATATKLQTARTINGTGFDGTANITTVNWGTARTISITDGTNTSIAVSVNGSANVSLNLPATIKANLTGNCSGSSGSCTGNAATATKLAAKRTIALSGAATGTATGFDGSGNITIPVTSLDASKLTGTASVSTTGNAATATTATTATNATYTNWLRTSSHSDYLFHTEWDGVYFWTYVTAGNGEYRAVRVARSDSAANADHATSADSATRATSADRAAAANCVQSYNSSAPHEIRFDWYSQVPGYVGLRVDETDMGGIVTTNRLVSDIRAQWYAAYPDGPEAHNAMWGGRDITDAFDAGTVSANIKNGTFKDIFPGDYITKQVTISGTTYTVNWVIADCDYWINKGDTATTAHHVVIVPQAPIFNANMNATNTTEGGYAGSRMYTETIPACATGIVNAFGSSHILTFRDLITNTVDNNVASRGYCGWTGASAPWEVWASAQCNLMTEHMVTGAPHYSSSGIDDEITTRQMSAFRLSERLINDNRQNWWLRNVVSSADFARVNRYGVAAATSASDVRGVRPFALLV